MTHYRRTLSFGSPPNPNGDLHLGHMSGPFLSADVFIRHRRMLGEDAHYVVGTDDNQVWTAAKAAQMGKTPQEAADHFAEKIAATFEAARLRVAHFYRPNAWPPYKELIDEVARKLYADGHLVARDAPATVCPDTGRYLFEVDLAGVCPHCETPTYGNGCENCGLPNGCVDLIDPVVKATGKLPEIRPVRRLFFPLEPHRERIEEYVAATPMSTQHRALCERMLAGELPEIVASHPAQWGLPVPIEGFDGQVLSAWIEMAPGYLAGSWALAQERGLGDWRTFWCADDAQVVQFFGSDNCWNHAVLYPVLLRAFDPEIRPPRAFVSFHLYRLDGEKFSTSRGHAVWARELVERSSADTMRCYVGYTAPEAEPTNFVMAEFDAFVEDELRGHWQSWLASLGEAAGGQAPEAGEKTPQQRRFETRVGQLLAEARVGYAPETFSLQRLTRLAIELVRIASDFGKAERAWETVPAPAIRATGLALELGAARSLALMVAPLMPDFADRLWRALGFGDDVSGQAWEEALELLPAGQKLGELGAEFFPPTP